MDNEKRLRELREQLFNQSEDKYKRGRVKYGDAWHDSHPDSLFRRAEEEHYEERQAIEHYHSVDDAVKELADEINYKLMHLVRFEEEYLG